MIPGLPNRQNFGNLQQLQPDKLYTLLRQLHRAKRAGLHTDVRIGNPYLGLLSWAAPKDLPQQGQKRLLITQPLHTWSYKDFQGQIKSKYGKGTVKKLQQTPIVIIQNTPQKIKFTRANRRNAPVYTMVKTKNDNWIVTVKNHDDDPKVMAYNKQHFKQISLQQAADMLDKGALAAPKLDGAGAIALVRKSGIDVYGVNKNKYGNPIRYTQHIGGLTNLDIPKELVGTMLRGQVVGQQNGRVLEPNQLSGLLNNTLEHNIQNRDRRNISLGLVALALNQKGIDKYDPAKVKAIVDKLKVDKIVTIPSIATKQQFTKQLAQMQNKQHPLTRQGFVIYPKQGRPLKAKLSSDADVIIRDIFQAKTKQGQRAGGFYYSLPNSQKVIGRVGSGIQHKVLKHMLANPQLYKNKIARIKVQDQYPSGAYRAPRFISIRPEGD